MTSDATPGLWPPGRLETVLETAARFFVSKLTERHKEHLRSRYGLTDETITKCRIGFAPVDRSALIASFLLAGLNRDEIRTTGLAWVDEQGARALWSGRIVFPYLINGAPKFFIARQTEETLEPPGSNGPIGKYKKQMRSVTLPNGGRVSNGISEPIFGADTVQPDAPLIITEGISDAIIAHQAGYPAVSPVTTRFKKEHANILIELCRPVAQIYLIMDNETSVAGTRGAVTVGLALARAGLRPNLCEIPRPIDREKVDLNDYIREGGNVDRLFENSIDVEEHPIAEELIHEERQRSADRLRAATIHLRAAQSPRWKKTTHDFRLDKNKVLSALPPLSVLTGVTGRGSHPVYHSTTGQNLVVDGERWYCFHKGNEGGGGPFEWIAVYMMNMIHEGETIPPDRFPEVLEFAANKYMPGWQECYECG